MPDPFDFDHFIALPRLSGLRLSPDGSRLVVAVATPGPDGKDLRTALWQVDPAGEAAPRRLTRSAVGESNAAFLPDGSLLFTSARPDPDAKKDDKPDEEDPPAALWHLPAGGGEARLLLAPPGGIAGMKVARDSGAVVLLAALHPDAADFDADRERHKARKDAGVSAMLYETYPIRYWDHYLGPRDGRYFVADAPADDEGPLAKPEDLTGSTGAALPEPTFDIAPDGRSVATTWRRYKTGATGDDIVVIDRATRERRDLTGGVGWSGEPAFSPDGRRLAVARGVDAAPDVPEHLELVVFDLDTGDARVVATRARSLADGAGLDAGRRRDPVHRRRRGRRIDLSRGAGKRGGRRGHAARGRRRLQRRRGLAGRADRVRVAGPPGPAAARRPARCPGRGPGAGRGSVAGDRGRGAAAGRRHRARPRDRGRRRRHRFVATAPRRRLGRKARRRSSCSCTAVRSARGPAGRGAGTRTCSSSVATPCSCPIRRCRSAMARTSSIAAGVDGASGRTRT